MALSFTDQYCIADPLTESTSGMLGFPWITRDRDGTLIMCYHDGVDGPGGTTRLKTSTDRGVTWSGGQVVWDEGLGTGGHLAVLSSGEWLLTSQGYKGGQPSGVYLRRSTDRGATWGATKFVAGGLWTSTAVFETASGKLLWPVYGPEQGRDTSRLLVSTDRGATWTATGTVLALSGGIGASEATLQQLPNRQIVALVRCTDNVLRRTVSSDDGATWAAPQTVTSGVNSRVDWVRLSSGRCIAAWRDAGSGSELAAYSDDVMATVSTPIQIHGPDWRTSYSALIEVAPGQVFAAIGEIDDGEATGRIMARYVIDGYGVAPTGEDTGASARQRSTGGIVAWDSFNRPDNAHGLGSADSGHQWLEYGGNRFSDWKLSGGMAVNSVESIHSVTVKTGNTQGYVEADLMWTGGTSSPIGLCANRSTITGHALVGKLDSAGQVARISYFDGSSITDLATATGLSYPAGVWHRFRLTVRSGVATLTIDGRDVVSYKLTVAEQSRVAAGARWGIWGGGSHGTTYRARNFTVGA